MTRRGNRLIGRRAMGALAAGLMLATTLAACGDDKPSTTATQAEPTAGDWTPWVVKPADVSVPAPPGANTAAAKADLAEVKRLAKDRSQETVDTINKFSGPLPTKPWTDLIIDIVKTGPKDPPLSSRNYALLQVAMYDAVLASYHWKYQFNSPAPKGVSTVVAPSADPSYPSEHAAIAGAAARVLAYLFPERPALRLDEAADQAADSRVLAGANRRSDVEAGLDLGHKVAEKVIAYAKTDGAGSPCNKKAPGGPPRYWAPPPGSVAKPVQPCAGEWKTWAMTSGSQFRPGPPPVFGSPEFLAQAREEVAVKNALTEEQKKAATFWAGGQGTPLPAGVWMNVLLAYLRDRKPSEPQAERTLALAAVAMSDAGVASWDAKFTYWDPRPQNGVRDSGIDKNWTPYIDTPFFPSYISGHATYSGAAAEVLTYLFPKDAAQFNAKAEEASNSRLWGGIHWRADNETGMAVGRKVGALVVERAKTDGGGTL